jgi:HAD superfamily phosphoserine phosphatase-like hydrolase
MDETSLVVFDFDGTLSRGSTICEVLADTLGRLPRMQEIELLKTRAEMTTAREEIALWHGGMTDSDITTSLQNVKLAPGLEEGFSLLREHGITIAIASITCRFAIEKFAKHWEIEHFIGTDVLNSGEIEHVWAEQKAQFIQKLSSQLEIPLTRIAAIGDSSGDFDMLNIAGEAIFVGSSAQQCSKNWLHLPNANIVEIAKYLIEKWH